MTRSGSLVTLIFSPDLKVHSKLDSANIVFRLRKRFLISRDMVAFTRFTLATLLEMCAVQSGMLATQFAGKAAVEERALSRFDVTSQMRFERLTCARPNL